MLKAKLWQPGGVDVEKVQQSRWRVHLAWLTVAVLTSVICTAAAWIVLQPAAPETPTSGPALYTVAQGEVGVQVGANAKIRFKAERSALSGSSGTVTSILVSPDAVIESGTMLLTIDLRPVVVAAGNVPTFRDLSSGMKGPDVSQLQTLLGLPADGTFGASTVRAVAAWQQSLGVPADSTVRRGDVVFLPSLPARGYVADGITVGTGVSEGDELVTIVGAPTVLVQVDASGRLVSGMSAQVALPDGGAVAGTLEGPYRDDDGLEYFHLVSPEGGPTPCDLACAQQFPVVTTSQVLATVDLVPRASGLIVPDSALAVLPDGSIAVRTIDEELIPVTVSVRGQGMSIVEGVPEGTSIHLFTGDAE